MNIALLGYGKEGQATEKYFQSHFPDASFTIFNNLTPAEFAAADYSQFDMIFRSPSVPPFDNPKLASITKYFFDHCPCKIIGVTATKGKGTTCSFVKALLDAEGYDAYLVGNIGVPAIEVLDNLTANSVVVYEMSSFQLWDLTKSPAIAIIGQIEPDHINVHGDYQNYLAAKSNIARFQTANDFCIYYSNNYESTRLAELSSAHKIPCPFDAPSNILTSVTIPGEHNKQNAMAAIAAVACLKNISPSEYCASSSDTIKHGLSSFHGLPHRLEYLRNLNNILYYDDNFSTTVSSTRVAVDAFRNHDVVLIVGGRDKTANQDLPELYNVMNSPNIKRIILIGESGNALAHLYRDNRFRIANSLEAAVTGARLEAEALAATNSNHTAVVLMSPAAASFDMFESVYDRGEQYQKLVNNLQ